MNRLISLIDSIGAASAPQNGKLPWKQLGLISCANVVHIKHVPFYEPCIIVVLSGRKVIFDTSTPVTCDAGSALIVPAPRSFDLRNEPASERGRYRALFIPFKHTHLERLRKVHEIDGTGLAEQSGILKYECGDILIDSLIHYLESPDVAKIVDHRLIEILLVLVEKDPRLLSFLLHRDSWIEKVRTIISADLAHEWELEEICRRLATSESTLRRQLQKEGSGFRDILYELRLGTALMMLLQTSAPVNQIAYECGYQSVSRFTSNFRKRFGLPPAEFREAVGGTGQNLTVAGHAATT